MRPRLIAVDDMTYHLLFSDEAERFNEATAYCRG